MFRLPLLLLAVLAVAAHSGCTRTLAPAALRSELVAKGFDGEELDPRSRGAWRRLKEVTYFGSTFEPWTWGTVTPALDACTLWSRGERDALVDIATEGPWEGRLWAMRALRHVDWDAFDALASSFRHSSRKILRRDGCLVGQGVVGPAFRKDVAFDHELWNDYQSAYVQDVDLEALLEKSWTRRAPFLDTEESKEAFAALDACRSIDVGGPLEAGLEWLLEQEPWVRSAGIRLGLSEQPARRYWGARILGAASPQHYEALRPHWGLDESVVLCTEGGEQVEHTLAEALRLHGDSG